MGPYELRVEMRLHGDKNEYLIKIEKMLKGILPIFIFVTKSLKRGCMGIRASILNWSITYDFRGSMN